MVVLKSQAKNQIKRMCRPEEAKTLGDFVLVFLNSEDGSEEEKIALSKLKNLVVQSRRFERERRNNSVAFADAVRKISGFPKSTLNINRDEDSPDEAENKFAQYFMGIFNNKKADYDSKQTYINIDTNKPHLSLEKRNSDFVDFSNDYAFEAKEKEQPNRLKEILFRYPIQKLTNIQHPKNQQCNLQEVIYRIKYKIKYNPSGGSNKYKNDTMKDVANFFNFKEQHQLSNNWYNNKRKTNSPQQEGEQYEKEIEEVLRKNKNELTDQILDEIAKQKGELEKCHLEGYPKINAASVAQYCLFDKPEKDIKDIVEFFIDPYKNLNRQTLITFLEETCFPQIGAIIHCNLPQELQ